MNPHRLAVLAASLLLTGACTKLGHIQQTEPVRTVNFTGAAKAMAQCVQQRLAGKAQQDGFLDSYVIYNSVKGSQTGVSHYSVTITAIGPERGIAAWRVVFPPVSSPNPSRSHHAEQGPPSSAAVQQYWAPVEDCAALQAKPAA